MKKSDNDAARPDAFWYNNGVSNYQEYALIDSVDSRITPIGSPFTRNVFWLVQLQGRLPVYSLIS